MYKFQIGQLLKHLQIILQRPIQYNPPKPGINLTEIYVHHVTKLLGRNAL